MVNRLVCIKCSRIVEINHTDIMVHKKLKANYLNRQLPTLLNIGTNTDLTNEQIIKLHTPIEIPKEHEYIINLILNLHGRNNK